MQILATLLIAIFGLVAGVGCIQAYRKCRYNKSSYGLNPVIYTLYGAIVWADLVIFGLFWFGVSFLCIVLHDYLLFLLILSVFWVVRGVGETLYWFHQQFTPNAGNPPEKFWHHKIFQNDSVWFVNQIIWQCITVIAVVASLYFGHLWLSTL